MCLGTSSLAAAFLLLVSLLVAGCSFLPGADEDAGDDSTQTPQAAVAARVTAPERLGGRSIAITALDMLGQTVELTNITSEAVLLGGYQLAQFPNTMPVDIGRRLEPGEGVAISVADIGPFQTENGELSLHQSGRLEDEDDLVSYVEWGFIGHRRRAVALEAGVWEGPSLPQDIRRIEARRSAPTTAEDWHVVSALDPDDGSRLTTTSTTTTTIVEETTTVPTTAPPPTTPAPATTSPPATAPPATPAPTTRPATTRPPTTSPPATPAPTQAPATTQPPAPTTTQVVTTQAPAPTTTQAPAPTTTAVAPTTTQAPATTTTQAPATTTTQAPVATTTTAAPATTTTTAAPTTTTTAFVPPPPTTTSTP